MSVQYNMMAYRVTCAISVCLLAGICANVTLSVRCVRAVSQNKKVCKCYVIVYIAYDQHLFAIVEVTKCVTYRPYDKGTSALSFCKPS